MKQKYSCQKWLVTCICALLFNNYTRAQNIFPSTGAAGIGTTTPDASSIFEMVSTSKGMLIPRMTITQRNAIAKPATGLLIYQTNSTPGFYYYSGTAWKAITPKPGWSLTGNAGTDPSINFIGTTDAQPLMFKVNNQKAGYLDYLNGNTGFGYQTLSTNASGIANTANGSFALSSNTTGNLNTANGYYALYSNTAGENNTANGVEALFSNTIGNYNTATGVQALYSNTTGSSSTANGYYALYANTTGVNNTANGYESLSSNTIGSSNTANGAYSLYTNTAGNDNTANGSGALSSNTTGSGNAATGSAALSSNTTGNYNTANGTEALFFNTNGYSNTADGYYVLYANTSGYWNTANGYQALFSNNTGVGNAANGYQVLYANTTGNNNAGNGVRTLSSNTTGSDNAASGAFSLYSNTIGSYNTANGVWALNSNITGNYNTALGYLADVSADKLTKNNAMALGYAAIVNASDKVVVGNSSVTVIGGQVGWSTFSDGSFKTNIKENVPGLTFINKLKPVTYNLELKKFDKFLDKKDSLINSMQPEYAVTEKKIHTGFVAQDVEKSAQEIHYDFDGVNHPQNDKDNYSLVYADFVPSLVKAVQELSKMNNDKDAKINELETRLSKLEAIVSNTQSSSAGAGNQQIILSAATLEQNVPNPFNKSTSIHYTLPPKFNTAEIVITDYSGKVLKQINISTAGAGILNVDARMLTSGAYNYSLWIDGKLIDTKRMVLAK
jgi:hypothetical protein